MEPDSLYFVGTNTLPIHIMPNHVNEDIEKRKGSQIIFDEGEYIRIKGARQHNLKNLDVSLPKNKLIVVTGVSGSGKSSLIMDTLYAEGQRRYVESLSSYARQFLNRMNKPEVDYITGLCPAIAIEQKVSTRTTRSTVGSLTEIFDYLKLLYARIGKTFSPISGELVKKEEVSDVVDYILGRPPGTAVELLAPFIRHENRPLEKDLEILLQKGFTRVRSGGVQWEVEDLLDAEEKPEGEIKILVDRYRTGEADEKFRKRVADSVQTALFEGHGRCSVRAGAEEKDFSNLFERDGMAFEEPTPDFFNFNSPYGACKRCEGFGSVIGIDEDLVFPDRELSVFDNAVAPWRGQKMSEWKEEFIRSSFKYDFPIHRSISQLSKEELDLLWNGADDVQGLNDFFRYLEENNYKIQYRVMLSRYRGRTLCPECKGTRIRKDAAYVKIAGHSIMDLLQMPVDELYEFFQNLTLGKEDRAIAERILTEINIRLESMVRLGLGYLQLNRLSNTLSGGETQRINLTRTLGSNLTSSMYILDEPSIGLHPKDNDRLISVLKDLRDLGNTVIVVEHDEEIMREADYILDMGPEAGIHGGEIVASGKLDEIVREGKSLTARYLSGEMEIPVPEQRRKGIGYIHLKGASQHNLKNIDVRFPLAALTVVTGVSGSGKSTLVKRTLYPALLEAMGRHDVDPGRHRELSGDIQSIEQIEMIDQNPIGKSSRSNPVTYVKAYDAIRDLYSRQKLSKVRGFKPRHFSFNVEGGRCEHCKGEGEITVEMQFLADIHLPCDHCEGKRFREEVLEVKYKGKSIHDVLEMSVEEALEFFKEHPEITGKLQPLMDVGLGYVHLGQSSSTLSGGEAQRVKLAFFLARGNTRNKILFLFDEPTTGLHFHDIRKLMKAFNALIEEGHTIVVIEHNPDVIKGADWIIDLGPEGGVKGGELLFQGTPEELAQSEASYTASFIRQKLEGRK